MKIKKLKNLRPVALAALGVFLGRGAQADTILDFTDTSTNVEVPQSFGDNVVASGTGITVLGFGTPNIGLSWQPNGPGDIEWQYYNDAVWTAGQLNNSAIGATHQITFTPNSALARVVVKSFNFHPYYVSGERFTYDVSLLAGTNIVSGPTHITFQSDATTNHPVNLNYTGALGQTLKLRIARVASVVGAGETEGDPFDIAVDDIRFAQLPEAVQLVGPQVVSVTPADEQTGVPAVSYPYLAGITNGDTTLVTSSVRLAIDGTLLAPSISSGDGLTNVAYQGTNLLSSGSHTYTLTYNDNASSSYTNEVQFITSYATLPASYALPSGSGLTRGFTFRSVAAPQDTTNTLAGTIARAKAQLAGTLIDPSTGTPYTNAATLGTNADGSFDIDTVLNFNDNGTAAGNFPDDQLFPGLDVGPYNWFSTEALLYLELPAGYHRFGVNSDDGFEVNALPPQGVSGPPILLGDFDDGRGAGDTLFDFLVQTNGIYCFQVIYFESTGSASSEFFSVTNFATGDKALINDPANENAIKSYRVLKPLITSVVLNAPNLVIGWAYGIPPFQVQFKDNITNAFTNLGSPTLNRTATVPIQPGAGFIRIVSHPSP